MRTSQAASFPDRIAEVINVKRTSQAVLKPLRDVDPKGDLLSMKAENRSEATPFKKVPESDQYTLEIAQEFFRGFYLNRLQFEP